MTSPPTQQQIDTFLQGKCSAKEREAMLKKIAEDPNSVWAHELTTHIWRQEILMSSNKYVFQKSLRTFLVAASILLLATSTIIFFYNQRNDGFNQTIATKKYQPEFEIFTTKPGGKIHIMLKDGSQVWLNGNSYLKLRADYPADRNIEMMGEAFFDVHHDPTNEFVVKSGLFVTKDIGTRFQVLADSENNRVEVEEGKVSISTTLNSARKKENYPLSKGSGVEIETSNKTINFYRLANESIATWRDNNLIYKDATLREICRSMERFYGVKFIRTGNIMLNSRYTFSISNLSLERALKQLCFIGNFEYSVQNRAITLVKK